MSATLNRWWLDDHREQSVAPGGCLPQRISTAYETTFDLTVTSDPLAKAGSITHVDLEISNTDTGEVIGQAQIPITVEAFVDATLDPPYRLVNLSIFESPLTSLTMMNTGNTPAEFTVEIVDPDDEVDFTLTSSTSVLIGAGFSDGVKVQLNPSEDAAADVNYSATVIVTVTGGPVLEAIIRQRQRDGRRGFGLRCLA